MSFDELISAAVVQAVNHRAAELVRPILVSQRTVEQIVGGLPAEEYLEAARVGAFPTWKRKRLVLARTADVVAYVETFPSAKSERATANDDTSADQDELIRRIGGRRVAS